MKIEERGEDERPRRGGRDSFSPVRSRCYQRGGDRNSGIVEVFDDPVFINNL
jgi:hypothetical protein